MFLLAVFLYYITVGSELPLTVKTYRSIHILFSARFYSWLDNFPFETIPFFIGCALAGDLAQISLRAPVVKAKFELNTGVIGVTAGHGEFWQQ